MIKMVTTCDAVMCGAEQVKGNIWIRAYFLSGSQMHIETLLPEAETFQYLPNPKIAKTRRDFCSAKCLFTHLTNNKGKLNE